MSGKNLDFVHDRLVCHHRLQLLRF